MADALRDSAESRYGAGMRESLGALVQLRGIAEAQREAAHPNRSGDLAALVGERQLIEEALQRMQAELRPLRTGVLAGAQAGSIGGLHAEARTIVAAILEIDRETLAILHAAVAARPARVQQLDAGEATLAAYRRTLAPTTPSKELIDQVG